MNEWRSIKELTIGHLGTRIDIKHKRRFYSNVQLSGIDVQHDIVEELSMMEGRLYSLGGISIFEVSHTHGDIHLSIEAEWRLHDDDKK